MSALNLIVAFVAGLGIGLFFFGGLWLTVRRISTSRYPALLTLSSFWVRLIFSLLAFYIVMDSHWQMLLACLGGFLVMRFFMTRLVNPDKGGSQSLKKG